MLNQTKIYKTLPDTFVLILSGSYHTYTKQELSYEFPPSFVVGTTQINSAEAIQCIEYIMYVICSVKLNVKYCICSGLLRGGTYWEIYLPSTKKFPSGRDFALEAREIAQGQS